MFFRISAIALMLLSGCAAAAVGAGAAIGAVAYSDRGAKSDVKDSVSHVDERTAKIFREKGIHQTGSEVAKSGDERTLKGKQGDRDITVEMKRTAPDVTHVEVIAKSGTVKWDKDYAKELLQSIVQTG